jgi:hypothetical protein
MLLVLSGHGIVGESGCVSSLPRVHAPLSGLTLPTEPRTHRELGRC